MAAKKEAAVASAIVAEPEPGPEPKAPKPKYAEDDNGIDARMWRLLQDHIRMGSRKA